MGVGISPECGERAERAVGGRSERTLEPKTESLVGRVAETARTAETRPFFSDGPESELLPGSAPDLDGLPPASWEYPEEPANSHDPREVTVQLSAAGPPDGSPGQSGKDGSDGPIFVDESGRRSRRLRRLGVLVAVACAVYAVVIVATLLSGNSNAPWLPMPGQEEDQPAGQVDTSPLPAQSPKPSGRSGGTAPAAVATAGDGTTPSAGATSTSGASAEATDPGASSDPGPTTSATTKPKPGVTTKDPDPDPKPKPSASVADPPPATSSATAGSTPDPTETAGTTGSTGAGTGTNAVAFSGVAPVGRNLAESGQSSVLSSPLPHPEYLL
jgi:hypothetical protein